MSAFTLPALPWAPGALEPHLSARTMEFHHGKHHQAYVNALNTLLPGSGLEGLTLEEIIRRSSGHHPGIFNNAAQVWNHTFYWSSMAPRGGGEPSGPLKTAMDEAFGSWAGFREQFKTAATTQFGSGWVWLVWKKEGGLALCKTGNAEVPLTEGHTPLLTMDVWEHAYYLDYQNRRADYADVFLDHLAHWSFAADNLARARTAG